MNYDFTANMEKDLDNVAEGKRLYNINCVNPPAGAAPPPPNQQ
jgi:hypothetical protein